jgi:hypothetical protein
VSAGECILHNVSHSNFQSQFYGVHPGVFLNYTEETHDTHSHVTQTGVDSVRTHSADFTRDTTGQSRRRSRTAHLSVHAHSTVEGGETVLYTVRPKG